MTTTNKSLNDSYVFRHLNNNGRIESSVLKVLQNGKMLNRLNLEAAMLMIEKSFRYPLKTKVLEAFNRQDIVLMYSPDDVKLPTAMPFFLHKTPSGKLVAIVVVDLYGRMDKESNDITIDAKKLYTMMEGAYIALVSFSQHREFSKRTGIIVNGSNIYANMIARVLNKKYALNVDKNKLHKVQFLAGKFFIVNILGHENNELATNYAIRNCVGANPLVLQDVDDIVGDEYYKDISTFINALKIPELNLGMGDTLTMRAFLEMFINMYDHSMVFALELFSYFAYNINAAVHGSYINNQYVLEDIIDRVGPKLYQEILSASRF